jgi:site-specific recombinase XerD
VNQIHSANPKGIELYYQTKILNNTIESMKSSAISDKNKALVLRFVSECFAEGLSKSRIIRYVQNLKYISIALNKDLDQCNKDDIKSVVGQFEMKDYSEWTRQFYKVTLKKFYAWLNNCDSGEYPNCVKWIRTSVKRCRLNTPEVLTKEEIEKLISACSNDRDRALLSVLWESGCRVGEIMKLRKSNIEFDEHGVVLIVNGKTGFRRVRVVRSAKVLSVWTDRLDSDSLIWINKQGNLITNSYFRYLLQRLARKVRLTKRIYPYAFRHSRATFLSQHLTEAQMKVFFGWTQGSSMASYYVHLSGRDLDKTLIELSQKG